MREWRDKKKKQRKLDLLNHALNQPVSDEDDDELFEFVEEYGEQEVKNILNEICLVFMTCLILQASKDDIIKRLKDTVKRMKAKRVKEKANEKAKEQKLMMELKSKTVELEIARAENESLKQELREQRPVEPDMAPLNLPTLDGMYNQNVNCRTISKTISIKLY